VAQRDGDIHTIAELASLGAEIAGAHGLDADRPIMVA